MPVKRFRSVEDMPDGTWYEPGDPKLYAAIRRVWGLSLRLLRPKFPPGVHKHRSIEAMNAVVDRWERENRQRLEDTDP
jgi:hypothetical protein